MKACLIKINLRSIKKNPNAGSTITSIRVNQENNFSFNCKKLPGLFKTEGKAMNCIIYEFHLNNDILYYRGSFININKSDFDQVRILSIDKQIWNLTLETKYNHNNIKHPPIESHKFIYVNTKLKCNSCKQTIYSDDLKQFDNDSDDNFVFTETGCPKCSAWDCVEIEYENITNALKRKVI